MSNTDTILAAIRESSGLTDAELVGLTGIEPHQQVNQICNRLARNGRIRRERDSRGLLVNRPVLSALALSQCVATLEATPRPGGALATGMRPARISDVEALDPTATLLVIACFRSKVQDGHAVPGTAFGPSILESLPENVANRLRAARGAVRERVVFDERRLVPALNRYSGGFYQAGGDELPLGLEHGLHVLIISGGYGALTVREPIGWSMPRSVLRGGRGTSSPNVYRLMLQAMILGSCRVLSCEHRVRGSIPRPRSCSGLSEARASVSGEHSR